MTVLVFSGVPSEVPPTGALFGCGRRDTSGAGRLILGKYPEAVASVQLQRQKKQSVRRLQGSGMKRRET
jgi:hypothetical protein